MKSRQGVGRTGKLFAHEWAGIRPVISWRLPRGIGGGFPIGACLATAEAAKGMTAGSVMERSMAAASLGMAVGNAVLDVVLADGFMENVQATALVMKQGLASPRGPLSECGF